MSVRRLLVVTAVVGLVLASCASDGSDSDVGPLPTDPVDPTASDVAVAPVDSGDGLGDGPEVIDTHVISPDLTTEVELAVADLVSSLGTDDEIEVVAAHEVTWPDGSLGCPDPGVLYSQALVDGYRIELAVDSELFEYHGARGSEPVACEKGRPVAPEVSPGSEDLLELEPVKPPVETEPTEELGGPGGQPDE